MKILVQRAAAKDVQAKGFAKRPNKPWEGQDYFDTKNSQADTNLMEVLGSYGKSTPSLHEIANVCGITGKMGINGQELAPLWVE